ncbi:Chaperone protein dnaJ 20, chloroplastic [Dionaea muscipula]
MAWALLSPPHSSPVGASLFSLSSKPTRILFPNRPKPDPFCSPVSFITNFPRGPYGARFGFLRARAAVSDGVVEPVTGLSFYELLGIPQTGTLPEIKQAYKQLARKYHPDVSPPDRVEEYTDRFIRVQEAYETLSDPKRRALYDSDMARGLHLAFSARKMYNYDEVMEDRSEWKNRWQNQLSKLRKRSAHKAVDDGNLSWAARMRRRRDESET